ncbi:beta-lactamase family protein [Candidatus Izimaplasma bacterium]|nr:beta-lactamase family protein [Candidatus Izimaplasma bacterium]
MKISGHCDDRFIEVKKIFENNFGKGMENGASFSVTIEGETVIDLWGGHVNKAKTKLWEEDTIVNVYSTSKFVTAICVLILADRNLIDIEAPVTKYWPEFAQAGKESITIANLLSHTSGLPGFDEQIDITDFYDWEKITTALSVQKPWWDDRHRSGYHAYTFGFLLGEVVRRVTGKTVGQFLREEITNPNELDFYIGLKDSERKRVAEIIPVKETLKVKLMMKMMGIMFRKTFFSDVFQNPLMEVKDVMSKEWQKAEIPAANGHGNAKAIAKIAAIIANGGEINGIKYLSKETIENALIGRSKGKDLVMSMPLEFGLGFAINTKPGIIHKFCPNPRTVAWGGFGGSLVIADLDSKMSIAYVMNQQSMALAGDARSIKMIKALYASL